MRIPSSRKETITIEFSSNSSIKLSSGTQQSVDAKQRTHVEKPQQDQPLQGKPRKFPVRIRTLTFRVSLGHKNMRARVTSKSKDVRRQHNQEAFAKPFRRSRTEGQPLLSHLGRFNWVGSSQPVPGSPGPVMSERTEPNEICHRHSHSQNRKCRHVKTLAVNAIVAIVEENRKNVATESLSQAQRRAR
ncbi:hypothetical protein BKA93DRAFT_401970 [Sparassis latifolia]